MRPGDDAITTVYQRLLAQEPDAPSDWVELLLDPLVAALAKQYLGLGDITIIIDVVTDALLAFAQHPERFDPQRGTLWRYLYMDALGDLHNAWAKERRRRTREVSLDSVAQGYADRNSDVEAMIIERAVSSVLPAGMPPDEIVRRLRQQIPNDQEWHVLMLMAHGERRTRTFAAALGLADLPEPEQRKHVKRVKDRIRIRLKRWGVNLDES